MAKKKELPINCKIVMEGPAPEWYLDWLLEVAMSQAKKSEEVKK